ncbi:hypothetical protein A4V00_14860 [Hungateiclostridiaceae bacterium KB18]|nr:hypothetical protein A4V00_14860 [Hungateiclostridiaceae bacterium KB18]
MIFSIGRPLSKCKIFAESSYLSHTNVDINIEVPKSFVRFFLHGNYSRGIAHKNSLSVPSIRYVTTKKE